MLLYQDLIAKGAGGHHCSSHLQLHLPNISSATFRGKTLLLRPDGTSLATMILVTNYFLSFSMKQ
nr:hypothetical protein Iba_chr12dCG2960 [Ipomoea batatas]